MKLCGLPALKKKTKTKLRNLKQNLPNRARNDAQRLLNVTTNMIERWKAVCVAAIEYLVLYYKFGSCGSCTGDSGTTWDRVIFDFHLVFKVTGWRKCVNFDTTKRRNARIKVRSCV